MPPAEEGAGAPGRPAWAVAGSSLEASPGTAVQDAEFAAIIRRAAEMGIPAWRVSVALGRSLPQPPSR